MALGLELEEKLETSDGPGWTWMLPDNNSKRRIRERQRVGWSFGHFLNSYIDFTE